MYVNEHHVTQLLHCGDDIEFAMALHECASCGDRVDSVDQYLSRPSPCYRCMMCACTVANVSTDSTANADC